MASSLTDMENPGADGADETATQDTAQPSLPAGGAPAGGGGLGSILGRALAVGLAGFAPTSSGFQNLMMKQVMHQQDQEQILAQQAAIGKAAGVVSQHLANGDIPRATAALNDLLKVPGAAGIPQVWALQKDVADTSYRLNQQRVRGSILSQARDRDVPIPGTGSPATPDQPLGTATMEPKEVAPPETPGEPPVQQQPTPQGAEYDLTKKGTPAVPPQTQRVNMRPAILNALAQSGVPAAELEHYDKLLNPAPTIIDKGPLGTWAYDHRNETMKVIAPGTLNLKPGESVSVLDWNNMVNGKPTVTQIASGGLALPSGYDKHLNPQEQLQYLDATRAGNWDLANQLGEKARTGYFAAQLPAEQKALAQRVPGVTKDDLAALDRGETSPRIAAIRTAAAQVGIQDKEIEKAFELQQTKQINMNTDLATKVYPHFTSYVDNKGNIVTAAPSFTGAQVTKALQSGQLFGLTTDQDNRYRMANNLSPQLQTGRENLPRLFAGVGPGGNLGNALALRTQDMLGGGPVRLQEAVNFDTSAEQVKILTGSSRGSQRMFELYMKDGGGTLNKTDTPESALAKNEFARNATENAKLTISGQAPMRTLDPYATHPMLRDLQALRDQGHHPTLTVTKQGRWDIVDHP